MFGMRTPVAKQPRKVEEKTEGAEPAYQKNNVRRSIGEWESGRSDTLSRTSTSPSVEPPKTKAAPAALPRRASVEAAGSPPKLEIPKYKDRTTEARACVTKAKLNLNNSRNIKTEIKLEVTKAIERLFKLFKEAESENTEDVNMKKTTAPVKRKEPEPEPEPIKEKVQEERKKENELIQKMEEYAKLMKENNDRMEKLKETLERQQENQEKMTYASVAAASTRRNPVVQTALHSVVVTGKDKLETGEEVLERIRRVVNAKEGGCAVERVRKAKESKIIVGCKTEEDRQIFKDRLKGAHESLVVEDMSNKNPLVILRDVFTYNNDEDILNSLDKQNKDVFAEVDLTTESVEIAYKKKTRNPHTHHIVLRVSPNVWQRMVDSGSVRIDLQRIRVADQSPLVQCSLCLGYGHGRRFCKETLEKCSHCGGPHMRAACPEMLAGAPPSCCNCALAKLANTAHNAFSQECTIRRKWDALARSTTSYR